MREDAKFLRNVHLWNHGAYNGKAIFYKKNLDGSFRNSFLSIYNLKHMFTLKSPGLKPVAQYLVTFYEESSELGEVAWI